MAYLESEVMDSKPGCRCSRECHDQLVIFAMGEALRNYQPTYPVSAMYPQPGDYLKKENLI